MALYGHFWKYSCHLGLSWLSLASVTWTKHFCHDSPNPVFKIIVSINLNNFFLSLSLFWAKFYRDLFYMIHDFHPLFSPTSSFIRIRQTSYRCFSRKTKRSMSDSLISRSAILIMSFHSKSIWWFNFPIVNFPFICSNIPTAPAYIYIYLGACGAYQDFLYIDLLLTT